MSPSPTVSIVVPTRNCLAWLPAALDSIDARPDLEILVVDDGSTDGTDAWLRARMAEDTRLVVLQGGQAGASAARNLAIAAARAPLIALLDADDTWRPGKLAAQITLHRTHPELAFSFTDYRHVTMAGEDRGACFAYWPRFRAALGDRRGPVLLGEDALALIYAENVVGTSTVVMRTDLVRKLGGFRTDLKSSEDWDLWLRLARAGAVGVVADVLADYRMHRPGNITGNGSARLRAVDVIATAFRREARRFGRWPERVLRARLLGARAELAMAQRRRLLALGLRTAALARAPGPRAAREWLATMRDSVMA